MKNHGLSSKQSYLGLSQAGFHHIIYYLWSGDRSKTPVICVHGLTRNHHDFDALAAFLSHKKHDVYCPDIVGRGSSDWLKNPLYYTYEQYLADLNNLIARTSALQVDWIGTSMGGLLGMILASLPNTPIRRLVMNDVGPQIPMSALSRLGQYVGDEQTFSDLEHAKAYFKKIYGSFGNLSEQEWDEVTRHSVRQVNGKYVHHMDPNIKLAPTRSGFAWQQILLHPLKALQGTFFDIDLWHIWRNVKCPVLVIQGMLSDMLSATIIKKMQDINPLTETLQVPDAGHAPLLRDEFTQEKIFSFLNP